MSAFEATIESGKADAPIRRRRIEATVTTAAYTTTILRSRAEIEAIAADWSALEAESPGVRLFQSAAWALAVFDFHLLRDADAFDPVVVALHVDGRLAGMLPLERVRTRFRRLLMPLGRSFGQYSDVMLAPGVDPATTVTAMLDAAIAAAPADVVLFLKVREDSVLENALPSRRVATGSEEAAPFVALSDYPDFATYHQTIKPKTRKNMRNARNRLERDGVLDHAVAETRDDMLGVISRTLDGRANRLRDQGLTSRAFQDSAFSEFCASLAEHRPGRPELLAMSLRHNGQPLAEQWGFVHAGRYYAYVASRDFSVAEESPGKLHLKDVIETAASRGIKSVDLLVPVMPYKLTWATGVCKVHDYAITRTLTGWIAVHFYDSWLRPTLKKAVLAMPRGLRQTLMKLIGRG